MAAMQGAKRMGQVANIPITGSLFTLVFALRLSVALFLGGWFLYGAALIIDGFARPDTPDERDATTTPAQLRTEN